MTSPAYPSAPQGGGAVSKLADAASSSWVRRIAEIVNGILTGKLNAVTQLTLTAGAPSTIMKDARITANSYLGLQPMTTHAATDLYSATSVLVAAGSQKAGQVTFNHPNNANVDKTFNVLIVG